MCLAYPSVSDIQTSFETHLGPLGPPRERPTAHLAHLFREVAFLFPFREFIFPLPPATAATAMKDGAARGEGLGGVEGARWVG